MTEANDFQRGDDFISFGGTSPTQTSSNVQPEAGPSRLPLSTTDQAILAIKNGRPEKEGDALKPTAQAKRKERKRKKAQEKEKDNPASAAVGNGKKRGRGSDDPVGPKNLKEERRAAERLAPWTDLVDWESCHDPAEMLNAEIDAFYRHVSPTKAEYEVRLFMIELITRAILRVWPDAEVTPFGSWQTQLYLPHGDIDLVVSTKRLNEGNKARMLAELARAMRSAYLTDVVAIIAKARVPIIKFVTTEGKLNVDISLNQTNGISAGQIVNQYLDVLPGCRQLILVVKAFLSQRSMNEVYTGGLGSYAVICLVISFLQLHPKLRRGDIDPEQNLGTLLVEFFELYGRNYSYDEVGISIRRGGSYFSKKTRGWYKSMQPFLLCIEDPQDRDNDISSGSFGIRQVKNTLAGAYEMLQAKLFERAEQLSGRKSGRYTEGWDPEEMSILTGVMGITKETQKHRRGIQRLHEEGRLQRLLAIPPNASPEGYVKNYRPPAVIGMKRKAGSIRLNGGSGASGLVDEPDEGQPSAKKRRNTAGLAAVMMDDDVEEGEIGVHELFDDSEDDDEDEEDEDEEESFNRVLKDSEDEVEEGVYASLSEESGVMDFESTEEGEIVEVSSYDFDNTFSSKPRANRDESVSHDSDDYEIQPPKSRSNDVSASEGLDSRYSVAKKGKVVQRGNKGKTGVNEDDGSVSETSSSGSSSIVTLSRPPSNSDLRKGNKGKEGSSERPNSVGKKEKRDFWAAKAGKQEEESDDDDAFGGGSDFVKL